MESRGCVHYGIHVEDARARSKRIAAALQRAIAREPAAPAPPKSSRSSAPTDEETGGPYRPMPKGQASNRTREGIDCPGCGSPMDVEFRKGVEIHCCITCAGLWLDPGELESMVDDPGPVQADVARLREGMKEVAVPSAPVRYRKCPRCAQVMQRRNYGSHSGVVVDECSRHGLYLDPGEYEAIEAFIQLGGLAIERKNREARQASARRLAETTKTFDAAAPKRLDPSYRPHRRYSFGLWLFG